MKLYSWNVNGIRAVLKKGELQRFFETYQPDILCLQETKAEQGQATFDAPEYHEYWNSSRAKKGYSGTVIFTPHQDVELISLMGVPEYDREGRVTMAVGKNFTVVNIYFPNGAASDERHRFKMKFLDDLIPWLKRLEKERPLIVCGDYNIAHTEIDIHDPVRNADASGFRPEERAWMTRFLAAGFVDTFRHLHPGQKDQYSWWSFRQASRARNKGWRIDYICVSESLEKKIRAAEIHPAVMGSDHCPISLDIEL